MIEFADVGVLHDHAVGARPALTGVTFTVEEGELVLVVGPTGSGKSTLLRCINGLVPHFSGGTLSGRVRVAGRDTRDHRPRDLADVVGFVGQDPLASFVTDSVEDELAYGMETLGVEPAAMRRRVEETLDLLGLADVRDRSLTELSGGQQQRVAIGAVLAAGPRVLVLDEPTSALDPVAAEDVLAALHRLVHDLGITVVLAEHRLERVIHHADRVLVVEDGRVAPLTDPADAMSRSVVHPPVIELGRRMGWSPLPLSIRDARRRAVDLRGRLSGTPPPTSPPTAPAAAPGPLAASVRGVTVRRGVSTALRNTTLEVHRGSVVAVMGRNGAGKSTLLAALVGQLKPSSGTVRVGGLDPAGTPPSRLVAAVGLVPQDPGLLLYDDTVAGECASADADFGLTAGTTAALLRRIGGDLEPDAHPRDLSEGQRLCLALSVILGGAPSLVLLDEPTRGLDYPAKARLVEVLHELARDGHAVVLATHDVELAADVADRVVVLADGDVVADGPVRAVLSGSPAFAPQVAKILHPLPYLTVADVVTGLGAAS
ncbi:ABC transporter ATP-binding protein [Lapillicoccus sp.]|uniref:ABC transporter ATP-binding protein n=1 Tax=Lapillicoccus sp. TaxID=1909287 RepID=UPI0039831B42